MIQLALSESRNTIGEAMSWAVPTRPSGWKPSKLFTVSSSWSAGTKPSYNGVATTAGATALTRMPVCRQFHREVVGQRMHAGLGHRVPGRRRRRDRLVGPHAADVDDRAAGACGLHTPYHGLGEEERGPTQLQIRVVVLLAVVEEVLGDEESGRVDQQRRIRVLSGELRLDLRYLAAVGEVRGDAPGSPSSRQLRDRLIDLGLLPPDDDGVAALPRRRPRRLWRPMPLLPPITMSFLSRTVCIVRPVTENRPSS